MKFTIAVPAFAVFFLWTPAAMAQSQEVTSIVAQCRIGPTGCSGLVTRFISRSPLDMEDAMSGLGELAAGLVGVANDLDHADGRSIAKALRVIEKEAASIDGVLSARIATAAADIEAGFLELPDPSRNSPILGNPS